MIKVFTLNKEGKIELTKEELEILLKEAKNEGYSEGISANIPYEPFISKTWPIDPNPIVYTNTPKPLTDYITITC